LEGWKCFLPGLLRDTIYTFDQASQPVLSLNLNEWASSKVQIGIRVDIPQFWRVRVECKLGFLRINIDWRVSLSSHGFNSVDHIARKKNVIKGTCLIHIYRHGAIKYYLWGK
jgi:hypothetical protein